MCLLQYCPAADYPVDACHDDKIPRCEKCNDQCATCLEKDICTACKDPSKVFSKAVLKCVSESELLTTCSQLNKAKGVQVTVPA